MEKVKKILVIRFRQIGDSILATALCSTLKRTFPDAEIHYVLNKGIAPLFEGHPDVDKVIAFDKNELKPALAYIKKVRRIVHDNRYDVIIDMRSTLRTLLFSLFSLHTPFRIGRTKSYTRFILNHTVDTYAPELGIDMVKRDLLLAAPLESVAPVDYTDSFRLYVSPGELSAFRNYMVEEGIDFNRPVMLAGVTAKLADKRWDTASMATVMRHIIDRYPEWQIVFNYAPGDEEADARRLWEELGCPGLVKINLQARSLRELAALCSLSTCYFGNEGGARHLAQAMGTPSLAIFSPRASKIMWLPSNDVLAEGIEPADVVAPDRLAAMTPGEQYRAITPAMVIKRLDNFLSRLKKS